MKNILIYTSNEDFIEQTAQIILENAQQAIQDRGCFTIALSGGNTPKPLYEKLAQFDIDWDKWHIFWGDERFVPADHSDSNEKMAREAWLNRVEIPEANIHPLETQFDTPEAAAIANEQMLKDFFSTSDTSSAWPSFDLALMGMGDDGHTASLFPGTAALQVCDHWVTVGNKDGQPRLTLSIPALNEAKHVLFLISGANKNSILKEILTNESGTPKYPIELIQPRLTETWIFDAAAGQGLS